METDVEELLRPDSRARLPFARQLLIYLNPFSLFKDASIGTAMVRERALSYNRAMRWMLVAYMRRWILIAAGSFVGIAPAEAAAAQVSFFILPAAAFAVSACIAFTVTVLTFAAYMLLGSARG
ncbi:MAG TPA: hypothetical protein VNH80_04510 [Burkholderiales bacterium]|nr:hypothetical protein [Burkholderiales bacterium]